MGKSRKTPDKTPEGLIAIERLAGNFAEAHGVLAAILEEIQEEVALARSRRLPALRDAASDLLAAREDLIRAVDNGRSLFVRPRSRNLCGVTVGLRQSPGRLSFDDEGLVIARIRNLAPDQAAALIRVSESLIRSAVAEMDDATLRRLGVERQGRIDEVVVRIGGADVLAEAMALVKLP